MVWRTKRSETWDHCTLGLTPLITKKGKQKSRKEKKEDAIASHTIAEENFTLVLLNKLREK